jgi:hypothetical protein
MSIPAAIHGLAQSDALANLYLHRQFLMDKTPILL